MFTRTFQKVYNPEQFDILQSTRKLPDHQFLLVKFESPRSGENNPSTGPVVWWKIQIFLYIKTLSMVKLGAVWLNVKTYQTDCPVKNENFRIDWFYMYFLIFQLSHSKQLLFLCEQVKLTQNVSPIFFNSSIEKYWIKM